MPPSNVPPRSEIDLNCDLGELGGEAGLALDRQMMTLVSSVNIACGAHAGDPVRMQRTIDLAIEMGVSIGAHPGYPDRTNFGRFEIPMEIHQIEAMVYQQVASLGEMARSAGARINHVKPHGGLYNLAARDYKVARAIATAIKRWDERCFLVGLAGSQLVTAAESMSVPVLHEAFADRAYAEDGSLISRKKAGAVLIDPKEISTRAVEMIRRQSIFCESGRVLHARIDTLCVHGDTENAVEIGQALRNAFHQARIEVRSPE
jgi:5-oxoprolinase (ATP-hydrolysing) subunit A